MFTAFTGSVRRTGNKSVFTVLKLANSSPQSAKTLPFKFPSTTIHTPSRQVRHANSNAATDTAFVAASIAIIGWVASSASALVYLDSDDAESSKMKQSVATDPGRADDSLAPSSKTLSYSEIRKHNLSSSCWVIINGQVYDVTCILGTHPGGSNVLLKNGGMDATKVFIPIHPPGTLSTLPPDAYLGPVDPQTLPKVSVELTDEEKRIKSARAKLPPPESALNLNDIEKLSESVLTSTAWAYYRSAGDDEQSYCENIAAFKRYWFRPRVLNKISQLSTATTMIGWPCSIPLFIAPAALARLGHHDGELNLVRGANSEGVIMCLSNNSSCSIDEVMTIRNPEQTIFFQLYMNKDRLATEGLIRHLEKDGFRAIILTVDAAVPGKRERDQRAKGDFTGPSHGKSKAGAGLGVAHAISGYQDPDVCWDDIPWLRSLTSLPLIIKGIQCVEDADKAFAYGAQAIILSNHGGRELDFSPSPMTVLHEIRLRKPELFQHEIYLDGGVTRGTDVVKALCLGARAVGLGRAFLYGNGVWGEAGVRRVVQIMREEIETAMRLLGVVSLEQLTPKLIRYTGPDVLAKL